MFDQSDPRVSRLLNVLPIKNPDPKTSTGNRSTNLVLSRLVPRLRPVRVLDESRNALTDPISLPPPVWVHAVCVCVWSRHDLTDPISQRDESGRADGLRPTFTFTPVHLAGTRDTRAGGERREPRGPFHQAVQAGVGEET